MTDKLSLAISLFNSGKKHEAESLLAEILKSDPDNSPAWYGMALCQSNNDKVVYCLQKVLALDPNNEKARLLLAKVQNITGPKQEFILQEDSKPPDQKSKVVCSNCGNLNDDSDIYCRKCGLNLHFLNQKPQTSEGENKRSSLLVLDILFIVLLLAIIYVSSLQMFPDSEMALVAALHGNPFNVGIRVYYDSVFVLTYSIIISFIYSIISIIALQHHPKISGGLWVLVSLALSFHPIISLMYFTNSTSMLFDMFYKGFLYFLFPIFLIFVFGLVKLFSTNNK
ncbi:MAG: zinc ribbon domain-containing protein [Anaerolineaceae bacterium]